ncbi:dicarboxylate/amino acid:cation symporter [Hyphomicrobium sp. MC1]|uniref:dicarboxylate/amino acid:cation symporter n=1 Tax=Hyphomicrobium sp. (strain MC1) TaxID=717785 RepID=UPI000213F271|nr:dicarboxylate/amino acid:cation symporter [Hyphomicrobium sp. MC1]CCB67338.1 citrate and C4-dicarboxylic acids transport protein (DAACS family) [Hyphomicrobium sp. MC1]
MQQDHETMLAEPRGRPFYTHLYFQVLTAIALGVGLGHLYPSAGEAMKPLGDGFVKLIKMLIGPIIFVTVVHGIASMGDLKKVGRVGIKALIYFEVLTTLALVIGLVVVNVLKPGAGMNVDIASLDAKAVASFVAKSKEESAVGFILDIIPNTFLSGFVDGNILQVLLVALLFAFGLQSLGPRGKPMLDLVAQIGDVLFKMVGFIMKLAPMGAFGAMAFTIGRYGIDKLSSLAFLMFAFYLTCLIFLFGVLGVIARLSGFSIIRYLAYIKDELLIVLGTSSSESVLPRLIAKMRKAGCEESVVGLVVPTGYSFNLDGTCIYLTMAAIFLAQATNTELTIWHEVSILGVLLLTSKGAAGVTGSGFITLAATLSTTSHIPVASLALILGIDRFMSEGRALMNLIGNGIATIVIAKSEGAIDAETFERELGGNGGVIADAA